MQQLAAGIVIRSVPSPEPAFCAFLAYMVEKHSCFSEKSMSLTELERMNTKIFANCGIGILFMVEFRFCRHADVAHSTSLTGSLST